MDLKLKRFFSSDNETIGLLYIDSQFFCFTLEDEMRNVKVAGKTRIPSGQYKLSIREEDSPMNRRYKNSFPDFFEGHIMLNDVPNFNYIYIHRGNTHKDTDGCILIGSSADLVAKNIGYSNQTFEYLYKKIYKEIKSGKEVVITIENE